MNKNSQKVSFVMRKRDGLLFSGQVLAISSENEIGPFDVLPYHANFVSSLKNYVLVHLDGGLKKQFEIQRGLLRVENNKAEIFVGW